MKTKPEVLVGILKRIVKEENEKRFVTDRTPQYQTYHKAQNVLEELITERVSKGLEDKKDHAERYFANPVKSVKELGQDFREKASKKQSADSLEDEKFIGKGAPLTKKLKNKLSAAALGRIFKNSRFIDKKNSTKTKEIRVVPTEDPAEPKKVTTTNKKGQTKTKTVLHKKFYVRNSNGKIVVQERPITDFGLSETRDTGKHNDEHSLVRIWNYFSDPKNKHHANISTIIKKAESAGKDPHDALADYFLSEVDKATGTGGDNHGDLNHPLNLSKSDAENEFTHHSHGFTYQKDKKGNIIESNNPEYSDEVRQRSRESHDKNMRDSALSLARLLLNKEKGQDRDLFNANYEMVGTGKEKGELNENALFYGMKPGTQSSTAKIDVRIFRKRQNEKSGKKDKNYSIVTPKELNEFKNNPEEFKTLRDEEGLSVKKGGGSQLESPDSMGFNVLYGWCIDQHCDKALKEHKDKKDEIEDIREQAHNIRRVLGGFHGGDENEMTKTKAAQKALGVSLPTIQKNEKGKTKEIQQGLLDSQASQRPTIGTNEGQTSVTIPKGYTNRDLGNELLTRLHKMFDERKDLFEFKPKNENEPLQDYRDFTSRTWGTAGSGEHKLTTKHVAHNLLVHGIFNRNKPHTRAEAKSMLENAESLRDRQGAMPIPKVDVNKRGNGAMSTRFRSGVSIGDTPSSSLITGLLPRLSNIKRSSPRPSQPNIVDKGHPSAPESIAAQAAEAKSQTTAQRTDLGLIAPAQTKAGARTPASGKVVRRKV